jgi:hypothetical protein
MITSGAMELNSLEKLGQLQESNPRPSDYKLTQRSLAAYLAAGRT